MSVTILIIFSLGLMPLLISMWAMRKAEERTRSRLRSAMRRVSARELQRMSTSIDQHYIEGVGYLIGDITCQFNAHSPYIRCAINPSGPCQDCYYYQSREYN
ncbi:MULTISPECIES: DUF6464 family protein [Cyanophyceae]